MTQFSVSTALISQQSTGPVRDLDRLDSWKEIANYLGREVRTVQLWEHRECLPVHRHIHRRSGSVYALRSELDAWRSSACNRTYDEPAESFRAYFMNIAAA